MYLYKKNTEITQNENIAIKVHETTLTESAHLHEFIELVYIMSGKGMQYIDGKEYKVSHGDLLFISYGQPHGYSAGNEIKFVNILLEPRFLSNELIDSDSITEMFAHSMFKEFSNVENFNDQCVHFSGRELEEADNLINMMISEYNNKKIGYKSALCGYVRILFTMLLRKLHREEENEIKEIMPYIMEYIDEHCAEKIHLADIAAKSFYNPTYFSRLLKQYCGKSFCAYIKEKRVHKAAELLNNKNISVETAMRESGYSDKKLFYRHFKEIYGVSPGEYRKR